MRGDSGVQKVTATILNCTTAEYDDVFAGSNTSNRANPPTTVSCSELGALFECDPRLTLRGLWLRKTRKQPERVAPGYVLAGQRYEPAVRQWYLDRHPGYTWDASNASRDVVGRRKGNLEGHEDGVVTTASGAQWVGEIKLNLVPGQRWYEVPLWNQWQVHGYMALTDLPAAVVVQCVELEERNGVIVAIDCREWLIEADRKVQAAILWETRRFIREHVRTGRPPAAVPRDLDTLKREAPTVESVTLPAQWCADLASYETLRAERRKLDAASAKIDRLLQAFETDVLDAMGEAETAFLPDGTRLIRKRQDRKGFTVGPATTYKLVIERIK
jgi:hypothetical protein